MRSMVNVRIESVAEPLNSARLIGPSVDLVLRAVAVGLLGGDRVISRLDLNVVQEIARLSSVAGVGRAAAAALLGGDQSPVRMSRSIQQLLDALSESPQPAREMPELVRVFGIDDLADLIGASPTSIRRYLAGDRSIPDQLGARVHWLALVVSDLTGSYNEIGIRRWFDRPRAQLNGRSPRQTLGNDWDPGRPEVMKVAALASSLAGPGSAT